MASVITESKTSVLNETQKSIFDKISKNEAGLLKQQMSSFKENVDFIDENGMTPLQHACYKGNKEIVQLFLDQVSFHYFPSDFRKNI